MYFRVILRLYFFAKRILCCFQIDIYGKCGDGNFSTQQNLKDIISPNYLFYLSFENSLCTDYVTEKFFRYFEWDVVLVVRGGADYERLLPSDTYIDASNFSSAKALSAFLLDIARSEELYTEYLAKKDRYKVIHYPGNKIAWCNICSRLNNLGHYQKTYSDHVAYLNLYMCRAPADLCRNIYPIIVCLMSVVFIALMCFYRKTKTWPSCAKT